MNALQRSPTEPCFSLQDFGRLRPWLFHVTHEDNLDRIRSDQTLWSADALDPALPECPRRCEHNADGGVVINDQTGLREGNIRWTRGWNMARFVRHLNSLVFFWPGRQPMAPIPMGARFMKRYHGRSRVVLRVRWSDLVPPHEPLFCCFNSGYPRWSNRAPSPRGAGTFVRAEAVAFPRPAVREVVFAGQVALPATVDFAAVEAGALEWRRL